MESDETISFTLQKVGETPGSFLSTAEQLLLQAGETLTKESPTGLSKSHKAAKSQLDSLRAESRALTQLRRAHERLQGHEQQVSKVDHGLETLSTNRNTRHKLQQAEVSDSLVVTSRSFAFVFCSR